MALIGFFAATEVVIQIHIGSVNVLHLFKILSLDGTRAELLPKVDTCLDSQPKYFFSNIQIYEGVF